LGKKLAHGFGRQSGDQAPLKGGGECLKKRNCIRGKKKNSPGGSILEESRPFSLSRRKRGTVKGGPGKDRKRTVKRPRAKKGES